MRRLVAFVVVEAPVVSPSMSASLQVHESSLEREITDEMWPRKPPEWEAEFEAIRRQIATQEHARHDHTVTGTGRSRKFSGTYGTPFDMVVDGNENGKGLL